MHILTERGLNHLKTFEGFRSFTYDDFAPGVPFEQDGIARGTLTIGYGHTGAAASPGNVISETEAEALLGDDLRASKAAIRRLVRVWISGNEYDALISFVFNIGEGNFERSTLLRKLNASDRDGAAMEFRRWVYSKGQKLEGLVMRREAEAAMFAGNTMALGLFEGALSSPDYVNGLAEDAEDFLGVGSATRPDAIEERGIMKPARRSKTIIASAFGLTGAAVSGIAGALKALDVPGIFQAMPPAVQMVTSLWIGAACLFLIWNRLRESRSGEH